MMVFLLGAPSLQHLTAAYEGNVQKMCNVHRKKSYSICEAKSKKNKIPSNRDLTGNYDHKMEC